MTLWQEYRKPTSIEETIDDLSNSPPPFALIAGGTDLLLELKQMHRPSVHTLIDVSEVSEMNLIELRGDELFIGAAIPINRLLSSSLLQEHATALIESCKLVAGPQVRNMATLGGNVAHALPAADGTIALTALGAEVEIADRNGLQRRPIEKCFSGPGISAIDKSCEIITGFYIPQAFMGQGSCFKRIMRPQGVALPILNCAVWVLRSQDMVSDVHIVVGPGGPVPFRATLAENALINLPYNDENISQAIPQLLEDATFRTSPHRATAEYRRFIVVDLFKKTLTAAWERAGDINPIS